MWTRLACGIRSIENDPLIGSEPRNFGVFAAGSTSMRWKTPCFGVAWKCRSMSFVTSVPILQLRPGQKPWIATRFSES